VKKLISYDLDGTPVDTREDIARAVNHIMRQMNARALERPVIERFVGRGLHYLIQHCLQAEDPKKVEKGAKIYRNYYAEHMLDHTRLYPGALEVLENFKHAKQAVITNKPDPFTRDILKALGVIHYFIEIVAGNSEYPRKPDPTSVLTIMKREKVAAEETLFVGDSAIDIETARNAGVFTAVITHGFTGEEELRCAAPDHMVQSFGELLALIRAKGW